MSITGIPFPKIEAVAIRDLGPNDTDKLTPALKKAGFFLPLPQWTAVTVAEYQGEIVGFVCLQLIPHMEPLWVSDEFRGAGVPEMLANAVQGKMNDKPCMCVAASPFAERLCRQYGMREIPGKIFIKE